MTSRAEVTTKFARDYARVSKKDKGRVLDQVVVVTGWSRDNARRRLTAAAKAPPGRGKSVAARPRKARSPKYSYDALKALQRVWAASGFQCGKYLVVSMPLLLDLLERAGHLDAGTDHYGPMVRTELEAMSAATIDRYLKPVKAKDQLRGISTTKPGPLLRTSIQIRRAGDEVEAEPGFFEVDTVAHCGPVLKGEFVRTVNLTCVHTGWTFTRSIRNNAHKHILAALGEAVAQIPFAVSGMDFDNGSEFLNHGVVNWAGELGIYFTRGRPYTKNDQATIESKNGHLVRRHAFYYRYDTAAERKVLNHLWRLVDDQFNFLRPTKKPSGWGTDRAGRRKRLYDEPATPLDRLLRAGVLSSAQERELLTYRDRLDPLDIARRVSDLQTRLIALAREKTEQLYLAQIPSALPEVRKGIHVAQAS
ncbi:transposase family protein [Brachybacterium vulturis]|uniref:transposase family protein n=1 Tax=Brachybacterium vulturis TaxID=2017484 RepID=UPI0037354399